MSQYFDLDGITLWNPSNGPARLFLRQVQVYEAELGLASGIGPMENDEAPIDPPLFRAFATALVHRHLATRHTVLRALSEGFVATVLVLAERAGADVPTPPGTGPDDTAAKTLRARARELDRAMTR